MGKVVHFEIPADDMARAQKFYRDVFGWTINSMPEMGYALLMTGPAGDKGPTGSGYINGGMMERSFIKTPVITIDVKSIDDFAKKIAEHGGLMIKEKMAIGEMGFAAYFKDSEGNILGLWEAK